MNRKKRNDRNYIIYQILSENTGDSYIGVTVATGRAFLRSVKVRVQKHFSRAKCETKDWALCEFIRQNQDAEMTYQVLDVIRGRRNAYQVEREYIRNYQPTLNTF
jgi:hypothetical protein